MSGHDVDDYLSDLLGAPTPAPKPTPPASAPTPAPEPEAAAPQPAEPAPVRPAPATPTPSAPVAAKPANPDEISEDEFEALLDQIHGDAAPGAKLPMAPPAAPAKPANPDEISEDEFEALLDQLHGGAPPGAVTVAAPPPSSAVGADEISEDEFEALLDKLHGDAPPGAVLVPVSPSVPEAATSERRAGQERRQRDEPPPEGIDRRSDSSWRGDDRRASHRSSRWLRMRVHEQDYAVELLRVQEVLLPTPVLRMRDTGSMILGVMNLRGVVVPVLDLGIWLGLEAINDSPQVRFVVLEHNGDCIALRVSAVLDVHAIPDTQIEPSENTLAANDVPMLRGVTRLHAHPVLLLDAMGLLG